MADYFISGVWKDGSKITDVLLHVSNKNTIMPGQKTSIDQVVNLIMSGLTIMAVKWDYTKGKWEYICPVEIDARSESKNICCRQSEGGISLANLINMNCIQPPSYQLQIPLIRKRR